MKKISIAIIQRYWEEVNTQTDEGVIYRNLKLLNDQQPLIMVYLMVADKDSLNEEERQLLYFLGSFIAHVMLRESRFQPIAEVKEEQWEKARHTNIKLLEFLASEDKPENFFKSMDMVINASPQTDLLRFMTGLLMDDPLCRSAREENVWRLFTHLKVVMDALDQGAARIAEL